MAGGRVSNMSLGTVQLGLNYGIANESGKPTHETSMRILGAATDNGVTSLDTARAYGDAETVLGDFLRHLPAGAESPFLTTKCACTQPAGAPAADVERELTESVEHSLELLSINKVNCLLLHNAADMTRHGDIVPQTLRRLIQKGYADTVGVSVYYPAEVEEMLKNDLYQATQIPMNLFDQRFSALLPRLRERGVAVFVRSVFLQGLFFMDPERIEDPALRQYAAPYVAALRTLAEKAGMSVAQLAVSFVRDLPGITSLVLGADNPGQVLENVVLLDGPQLDERMRFEAANAFAGADYEGVMSALRKPKPQTAVTN